MEITKIMLGDLQTNCFFLHNARNECVIVDPGGESRKAIEFLNQENLNLVGILITHGHFDHIGAVDDLVNAYDVPVYTHKSEAKMMADENENLSSLFGQEVIVAKATRFVKDHEVIKIGSDFEFTIIEVPGHTSHSVCFYSNEGHLFTGDTLFNGAVGRTDLYSGHPTDLMTNIKNKLFVLDEHTKVYPGHGLITSIKEEKEHNPFFAFK